MERIYKQLLTILYVTTILISCGNSNPDPNTQVDSNTPTIEAEETIKDEINYSSESEEILEDVINTDETTIGNNTWQTKNLNVDKFRNGDLILHAETDEEWREAGSNCQPAWCYYDNNIENEEQYGKLYNWYAVNDPRGLAPLGWHIPSDAEWKTLTDFCGGGETAARYLKSLILWQKNGGGDNKSGFNALPGGFRYSTGSFDYIGYFGLWWTSSREATPGFTIIRELFFNNSIVLRRSTTFNDGLSVRCIKDPF